MPVAVAATRKELTPAQLRLAADASKQPARVRRLLAIAPVLESWRVSHGGKLLTPERKAESKALVVAGPDPERDRVVRWRSVALRRLARRDRPPVRGRGAPERGGRVAAPARPDAAAAAAMPSEEEPRGAGGT